MIAIRRAGGGAPPPPPHHAGADRAAGPGAAPGEPPSIPPWQGGKPVGGHGWQVQRKADTSAPGRICHPRVNISTLWPEMQVNPPSSGCGLPRAAG